MPVTTVIAATLGEFGLLLIITGLVLLVVLYKIKISKTGHTHTHLVIVNKTCFYILFILSCPRSV